MFIDEYVKKICADAKSVAGELYRASSKQKNGALIRIADALSERKAEILAANAEDIEAADENGVPKVMIDRLRLTEERIEGIADAVRELVALADPVGRGERWTRPNGLEINCIRVPLGVVAMIYEARPNVTADAAALCIKSGNACVLRGGKEALCTNRVIVEIMKKAIYEAGFSPKCIGFIDTPDRAATTALMNAKGLIDVLIPRGGKGLIRAVADNAHVPVIETGAGNCHIYVDEYADIELAVRVAVNAKFSRPSVCNAVETVLLHEKAARGFLSAFVKAMPRPLEIRGCEKVLAILPDAVPAEEQDWAEEYNDYILAVKVVPSVDSAIEHIRKYSTGHSEAIMTSDSRVAKHFISRVDSAAVYVNASTRFTDGGEFGFGAEIGISTQKLHARGPMGLDQLTTVKYVVEGNGQIR
ncbi:MAG: glutamate-5-semialdehyde dehydrogenase [Clostridia bacterium]|nr:glutamate-5-semialdehyde dehydrogenase [Clostridia bacterium]